jgi:phosphohistidine phosphatase SixA
METLVIARHGEYDHSRGSLSLEGRQRMAKLALCLYPYLYCRKVIILTSTATRAVESAHIIKLIQDVKELEQHEILWSDREDGRSAHPAEVLRLIRTKREAYEVVILVTHYEYCEEFPSYYAEHELKGPRFTDVELRKAEAWVIDCATGHQTRVSPD